MKLIAGLGNPGSQYARTRHNVGFMVIDRLTKSFPGSPVEFNKNSQLHQVSIQEHVVLLLKPQTYMNRSGIAVREMLDHYDESPENLIVIYDDLDLDVGRVRIRQQGGHGGHKGIQSVIEYLGTQEFVRIRIGIGRPDPVSIPEGNSLQESVVEYVLQPFAQDESLVINEVIERVAEAIVLIVGGQLNTAMTTYNRCDYC